MASRPTKYAHVVKHLPKLEDEEPGRLALLDRLREEILSTQTPEDFNIEAQILSGLIAVQKQVEAVLTLGKRQVGDKRSAAAFTSAYATTRIITDTLGDLKSAAQLLLDAYERLMTDQMEAEGMRSLHLESGASVTTFEEPCGKVVDKEAFRLWCVAPSEICMTCGSTADIPAHDDHHPFKPGGGYERLLQLWPSTMNSIVKERTLNAAPPPDGVEVYAKTTVRLNKA